MVPIPSEEERWIEKENRSWKEFNRRQELLKGNHHA